MVHFVAMMSIVCRWRTLSPSTVSTSMKSCLIPRLPVVPSEHSFDSVAIHDGVTMGSVVVVADDGLTLLEVLTGSHFSEDFDMVALVVGTVCCFPLSSRFVDADSELVTVSDRELVISGGSWLVFAFSTTKIVGSGKTGIDWYGWVIVSSLTQSSDVVFPSGSSIWSGCWRSDWDVTGITMGSGCGCGGSANAVSSTVLSNSITMGSGCVEGTDIWFDVVVTMGSGLVGGWGGISATLRFGRLVWDITGDVVATGSAATDVVVGVVVTTGNVFSVSHASSTGLCRIRLHRRITGSLVTFSASSTVCTSSMHNPKELSFSCRYLVISQLSLWCCDISWNVLSMISCVTSFASSSGKLFTVPIIFDVSYWASSISCFIPGGI